MSVNELTERTLKDYQALDLELRRLQAQPRIDANAKASVSVDESLQQELSQCRRDLADARTRAEVAEHEIEIRQKELQLLQLAATVVSAEVVAPPSTETPPVVAEETNARIEQLLGRVQSLNRVLAEREKARIAQENRLDALRVELSDYE